MSKQIVSQRITVPEIMKRKGNEKIVCLTAYTTPMANLLDPHVDLLLVGDSVGMVMHGLPSTVGVTLEMMILHGQAVMRGANRALVVVDLPFGSYEESPESAYKSAVELMKRVGCQAVKVEASKDISNTISFLVDRGIPVVGHVGLRPQAIHLEGGFKAKGKTSLERELVMEEALSVEKAGAFAVVVEGVASDLAEEITRKIKIPTIGIGASPKCDGQILVTEDMLGLFEWTPKFVRRYANLKEEISKAVESYTDDVRKGLFPGQSEMYMLKAN
ncbi:3-methyl-2-oxobutanoate hydroxymethyltransferase [Leptospira perolatii]|uniref:3-methyl-2-oxobutanoate hydroxymethyltransferase n=1 Tax=Leptospira perolatii TaxID=2023191 RepID=A0A2M9ZQG2_9LEPT|nr:3-methyl-2-oxobutanoate hydroxymethyltransferase [Leptospira perolatii]PJZ70491.1 3-methyl-2-oxobutanoate hydroxymethyltransferase [Leptospira perolatii]PJZ74327.1 3-methyl-2-oxobutanoate hydroxymethyltransferase [Leptospira perolatii]